MIGLKSALATFFSGRAEWRRQEAIEHPEDAGISRNAEGLEALAEWVQGLDDADPRLLQLAAHDCWDEGLDVFAAGEEGGARPISIGSAQRTKLLTTSLMPSCRPASWMT